MILGRLAPDGFEQPAVLNDPIGVTGEVDQQLEFLRRQPDFIPSHVDTAALEIDSKQADLERQFEEELAELLHWDRAHLTKIYPLLKGAAEFWEARLITTTVTDASGVSREVLVADSDWSPEHGPLDAKGITYAQELVWNLFGNYHTATQVLGKDTGYAKTIDDLRARLYLPVVSPKTGWLEEWMSPDNLGETTHRHLSPLFGLFPGDRIRPDDSTPKEILAGATALLTARGMNSYGWANAWRSLCWARLKNADKAYQLVVNNRLSCSTP